MKKELFDELLESAREMVDIREGKKKAARITRYKALDPKSIRARSGLTQERFASLLGIKLSTYRNWEQGRRVPQGPAQVLLMVADYAPGIIREAIRAQREERPASGISAYEGARTNYERKVTNQPLSENRAWSNSSLQNISSRFLN